MRKLILLSIIAACIIVLGFKIRSVFFPPRSSASQIAAQKNILNDIPKQEKFIGIYSCLPNNEPSPLTVMCILGLKMSDGSYIALNIGDNIADKQLKIETGDFLITEGLFVPIEQISSDQWKKHNIKGILKVTKITKR
jgi:hypothetical protein